MEWWKEGEFFDREYISDFSPLMADSITKKQVDFIVSVLPPGSDILDLAGGHGRHTIELATRGFNCTLLDINRKFLAIARELAVKKGVSVRFVHQDMREMNFYENFDAVISMATSFGYFSAEEDHFKVIDAVFKALKKGGKFLLDLDNRERVIRFFKKYEWFKTGEAFVLREAHIDLMKSRLEEKIIRLYLERGIHKEHVISIRLFTLSEICQMLSEVGFKLNQVFGDYDLSVPYTIESPRMIILCQKT